MVLNVMLAGYMFLWLSRIFEEYPVLGDIHIERIWMLGLIIAFFVNKPRLNRPWPGKAALFFPLAVILLSGLATSYVDEWSFLSGEFSKVLVFSVILSLSIKDEQEFRWIVIIYVAVMFLYEFKSALEFANGRYIFRMGVIRMVGIGTLYNDPNAFASSINFTLPFAVALMRDEAVVSFWARRVLPLAFILVGIFCVVMTGSRSGLVILVFVMFCQLMTARKGRLKTLLAITLLLSVAWHIMPPDKKERFANLFESEDEIQFVHITEREHSWAVESEEARKKGLIDGWELLLRRPILGYGAGSFPLARGLVGDLEGLGAHNLLGQVMGELGVLGLMAFGYLVWFLLGTNLSLVKKRLPLMPYSQAVMITTMALLINGYGAHIFYRYNWWWMAAFTSILMRLGSPSLNNASQKAWKTQPAQGLNPRPKNALPGRAGAHS